jgi:hypothetical protein
MILLVIFQKVNSYLNFVHQVYLYILLIRWITLKFPYVVLEFFINISQILGYYTFKYLNHILAIQIFLHERNGCLIFLNKGIIKTKLEQYFFGKLSL